MTIVYLPTGKCYDVTVTTMKDIIEVTDTISPFEKFQYKTFDFIMTQSERNIVLEYFKRTIAHQNVMPYCDVEKGQPTIDKIYLDNIGSINLKSC